MCGIAACIKKEGKPDRKKIEAMTDVISYRGPNDRGICFFGNLALGHRRLSIIDLSDEGHQPFELIEGYALIYNGEIYNYIELREELTKKGHEFKTKTDTEVIIHAYVEWGTKCVEHFNGMWSFVLYDKSRNSLFGSRDRFGVKPFYYTEQEGMFLIASEIKQFFEMLDNRPKVNKDALMRYIIRGTIDCPPQTMFADIYQLEPGHNLIYSLSNNTYYKERYYDISTIKESKKSYREACNDFKTVFLDAVNLRLRSDVPLGYFLSGGLDSSAIVCAADKLQKQKSVEKSNPQHAISACFAEKEYDEQEYIDAVIDATDVVQHKVFPELGQIWGELDDIIWHMDEPLGSTSAYAQWSVCRAARENGLTVMLDGQGADEQLAGYTDFYPVLFSHLLKCGKYRKFKHEVDCYIGSRAKTEEYDSYKMVILSAMKTWLTPPFMARFFKQFYLEKVAKIPFDKKIIKQMLKEEVIYPIGSPRKFIKTYVENELVALLHREDRNSMAFSIESRTPFLDYQLVNCIYQMPIEYKIKNGLSKAVMRNGLEGILPEKVAGRISKFGFVTPEDKWINDNAEFFRQELVNALEVFKGLFDTEKVLKWYDTSEVKAQRGNSMIWRIIDSSRWIKIFNVRID